jgi:hypothetical protein
MRWRAAWSCGCWKTDRQRGAGARDDYVIFSLHYGKNRKDFAPSIAYAGRAAAACVAKNFIVTDECSGKQNEDRISGIRLRRSDRRSSVNSDSDVVIRFP